VIRPGDRYQIGDGRAPVPPTLGTRRFGATALSAVAIYNGYPFYYFDTHGYYTGGQKSVGALLALICDLGLGCPASAAGDAVSSGISTSLNAGADGASQSATIGTGRSPFYGVFLYLSDQAANIWLIVAAQALATSWLLYFACRYLLTDRWSLGLLCVIAMLAAFSSAPFFVGYLMPDVFAGLCILAAALLIAFYERLSRVELMALGLLLACSLLFHRSHVLTAGMLLGSVTLFVPFFVRSRLGRTAPALALIGATVAIGAVGFIMLDVAVSKITGRVGTPPPFLLARVIEDGPGTSYLRQTCGEEHYAVCRFVDRMPIQEDDFLWSREPERGVWYVVSPEERVQIAQEQYAIVLRSFLHAPLAQMEAIARNFGQQVIHFSVVEFDVGEQLKRFISDSFGGAQAEHFMASRIARDDIDLNDLKALSAVHYLVVVGALILLLLRFRTLDTGAKAVFAIVLAGVVLNALATGTVSTPNHRFQARVIWLLPALAAIVEFGRLARPGAPREPGR
jgi:hypothetical protein